MSRVAGLEGRVLAITRGRKEAAEFSRHVKKEGGKAIAVQCIEVVPEGLKAARRFLEMVDKKKHDYCAFMSVQSVALLFDLGGRKKVASALKSTEIIAVGPKTKQELEKRGVKVGIVPDAFSSAGLVEMLSSRGVSQKGKKIIIPRSAEAGDYAAKALSDLGMAVDEVFLYSVRTAKVTPVWERFYGMLLDRRIDAVVFTSASNVRSFFEIIGSLGEGNDDNSVQIDRLLQAVVSIGPFTSAELKKRKVKHYEADRHTVEGTIEAAKKQLAVSRSGQRRV